MVPHTCISVRSMTVCYCRCSLCVGLLFIYCRYAYLLATYN